MSFKRLLILSGIILAVAIAGFSWNYAFRGHRGPATPGKATTFYDGPVDSNGYLDFYAAYNDYQHEQIKPEDNAAYQLLLAVGPEASEMTENFKLRWQILTADLDPEDPLGQIPADHRFLQSLDNFVNESDPEIDAEILEQYDGDKAFYTFERLDECYEKPWAGSDYPIIDAWIDANRESLELVIEGTGKPDFWAPAVPLTVPTGNTVASLIECDLSEIQKMREAARCLVARAMRSLAEGDVEAAQSDLIATRRLGLLLTERGSLVQSLVGLAIQGIAFQSETAMLQLGQLSPEQIQDYLDLVAGLPAGGTLARNVHIDERTMGLSAIQQQYADKQNFDLNLALSIANEFYDKLAAAAQDPPDPAAQQWIEQRLAEIEDRSAAGFVMSGLFGGRPGRTKMTTEVMMAMLLPAVDSVADAYKRSAVQAELILIALELETHKNQHGSYPDRLEDIEDRIAEQIGDRFDESGASLRYSTTPSGYLLYSIGVDGIDSGGVTYGEQSTNSAFSGDDIRVCIGEFEPAAQPSDQ
ncbi:MAG: hypothetical protein AAF456_16245 [Planctomycetota bacterium]